MEADESKVEAIFCEAIERTSAAERASYLDQACAGDTELRARVARLLGVQGDLGRFLENDAASVAATLDTTPVAERPGQTIGRYQLLEEIGEGGMGVVYLAEQREPVRRKVALKIIKPGMDTREVVARFEAERQALAMMDHPNIAHVLDGGATESGRPYFVMELVQGIPITDYCDQASLTTHQRLNLFVSVCQAVLHAHQKGIIHRDLKPSNILVTLYDGAPVPKIIDFGIAKATHQHLTEKTLFTSHGQMVGTPQYISPEQAEMSGLDIDTRSDIYSLGVVLYELLTGNKPFDRQRVRSAGLDELRRMIREEEPPRPSHRLSTLDGEAISTVTARRGVDARRLGRLLRGDLDWIVMKALEKDRARRYQTAGELARDIEHYLADEPVQARPPRLLDRTAKWARRHRAVAWSAAAAIVICAVTIAACAVFAFAAYQSEREQRTIADANAVRAEQNFDKARRAVDEMYTGVAEKWLEQRARLTDVQRDFLEKALAFYGEFAKEEGSDPQVRHEAVVALQRVGAIQEKLGDVATAETSFAQSVRQGSELVRQHPDRPEFRLNLACGQLALARIHRTTGRAKQGEQEADLANQELPKLASAPFVDAKYRQRLAQALQRLCSELTHSHRLQEAEAAVQSALKTWESLVKDFPAEFEYRFGLAKNYGTQGMQRMWWGSQNDKAEAALREAASRLTILHKERPDDVRIRLSMANSLTNLGAILSWTKRLDEQVEVTLRAANLYEKLAEESPEVPDYQGGMADALNNLADAENGLGRRLESEKHYRAAMAVYERLADRHPDVVEHESCFEQVSQDVSLLLDGQARHREACQILEKANSRAKKALKRNPAQRPFMVAVVNSSSGLAVSLVNLGDHAQAARTIEGLLSVFEAARDRKSTEFPEAYEKARPGKILMSEASEKFFLGSILMSCAALAERDSMLSPAERKKAVQTYTDQAGVWLKEATRVADEWLTDRMTDCPGQLALGAAMKAEAEIGSVEQKRRDAATSPRTLEIFALGRFYLITAIIRKAIGLAPDDPCQYQLADILSSAPDGLRDPDLALELARRAVSRKPKDGMCRQSLGWALYRKGDWKGSIDCLKKQTNQGESEFVLAMAYWQLGEKAEARSRFDRGSEWLKGYEQRCEVSAKRGVLTHPPPVMLKRFQAEAAAMLGIALPAAKPLPKEKDKTEAKPKTESGKPK